MTNSDWYRRATWTDVDREDFNARLKRCRANKAQYLRVQAYHLAEAGDHKSAIELLDRLLADFPDMIQFAQAHAQKAESLAHLGRDDAAIGEYREAMQAERDFPNVRTQAWLDFGWFVVERQRTDLFGEVLKVLQEFRDIGGLQLPDLEYRYATILALIVDAFGEREQACQFARRALAEAEKRHSGLRYHPTIGLVGSERSIFEKRLNVLAGS